MGLQFVNIKAWMLALIARAGWVVNAAGQASRNAGERLAIICCVMVAFAFQQLCLCAAGLPAAPVAVGVLACCGSTAFPGAGAGGHRCLDADSWTRASHRDRTLGLWLGVLGVAIFAVTLPATRLATGRQSNPARPGSSPWAAPLWRGCCRRCFCWPRARRAPARSSGGTWAGPCWAMRWAFRCCWRFALRSVTASHAAVVTALLPLVTAAVAALVLHQRARLGFWLFAVLGSLLVVAFSLLRGGSTGHGFQPGGGGCAAGRRSGGGVRGPIHGARITRAGGRARDLLGVPDGAARLPCPPRCGCGPTIPVAPSAWGGFLYVGVFSMWAGFFAWYRGLALGGRPAREPDAAAAALLSILAAAVLLGESLDLVTWALPSPLSPPWWRSRFFADMDDTIALQRMPTWRSMTLTNWTLARRAERMNPSVIADPEGLESPASSAWLAACRRPRLSGIGFCRSLGRRAGQRWPRRPCSTQPAKALRPCARRLPTSCPGMWIPDQI